MYIKFLQRDRRVLLLTCGRLCHLQCDFCRVSVKLSFGAGSQCLLVAADRMTVTRAHQHTGGDPTTYRAAEGTVCRSILDSASSMELADLAPPSPHSGGKRAIARASMQRDAVVSRGKFLVGLSSDMYVELGITFQINVLSCN
jgi:hypothetical protein